ncbi:hypothetical protein OEZ49_20805 [Ruegeria sp. WL0004]|uniref:Calcium-binding protein n=1 Tax=Ruegeria marisflavi TaxID=2984152 RepID=A0ABT2WYY3_9RHOB|nr:calcium-binding protein [Ruegeria sp. WL0004]MCU9840205.1 hypothetical protein [Ruegeria sp. WL0004]
MLDEADIPEHLRGMEPVYAVTVRNDRVGDGRNLLLGGERLVFADRVMTPDELVIQTGRETGAFDELIEGADDVNDTLSGGFGADTLRGLGGNDSLSGDEENDLLEGGSGDDTLIGGQGVDVLEGGEGDDVAIFSGVWWDYEFYLTGDSRFAGSIPDLPEGITLSGPAVVVKAREAAAGGDQWDFLVDIEQMQFSNRSDSVFDILLDAGTYNRTIRGTVAGDTIAGGVGHDDINGDSGGDIIFGGPGNDTLDGDFGNDALNGGLGNDALFGGTRRDELHGGDGNDFIRGAWREGDPEDDLADTVYAGDGNDTIYGGYGNDLIYGMDGNDVIAGDFGADLLIGQGGDDVITGSAFSDMIFGNAGNDFVNGG